MLGAISRALSCKMRGGMHMLSRYQGRARIAQLRLHQELSPRFFLHFPFELHGIEGGRNTDEK